MNTEEVQEKMKTLVEPVMKAIESCKDIEEILMLASIMMTTSQELFENAIGRDNTKTMIEGLLKK